MIRYCALFLTLFGLVTQATGQQDSTVLSFDRFLNQVQQHHPVAIQASLQEQYGKASLLNARGGFDPKVFADVRQKYFDGTQYYALGGGGLSVPTWFGLEFKGGYEQNQGVYLNPEQTTPRAGLWYLGLSVPLGQGLLMDDRRAQLKQAKTFGQITLAEQQLMLNKLQLEAGKVYWDWFVSFHTLKVYREALQLAQLRFDAVREGALLGDRPSIDTVEAGIQVQNRQLVYQQALLMWSNSSALLESFLWGDGVIPLELDSTTIPNPSKDLFKG
ncbi:TolC family protein [bacterium SCSIO 12741]|nr:TolC family protein [bacterium SCSIO 12741]